MGAASICVETQKKTDKRKLMGNLITVNEQLFYNWFMLGTVTKVFCVFGSFILFILLCFSFLCLMGYRFVLSLYSLCGLC